MKNSYNLNHENLSLVDFPSGKTQNIAVKIGKKTFMVDISANCNGAEVQIYERLSSDRKKYSKYASHLTTVIVQRQAVLNRGFFEKAKEIAHAQILYSQFDDVIK